MAEVREETELAAAPAQVWRVVRDWAGFVEAMGNSVEVEGRDGAGQLLKISMGESLPPVVERVEELDSENHRLAYSIVSGPFPVVSYRSTMQLTAAGEGRCTLTWVGTFDPAPEVGEEEVCTRLHGIYQNGIAKLRERFGS